MIKQQKEKIFFFQKRRESANYVIIFFPPFPEYIKSRHNSPRSVLHLDRRGWRVVATVRSPLRRAGSRRARRSRPSAVRSRRLPVRFQSNPMRVRAAPSRAREGRITRSERRRAAAFRLKVRSRTGPSRHIPRLSAKSRGAESSRAVAGFGLGVGFARQIARVRSESSGTASVVSPRQSEPRRAAPRRARAD